MSAALGDSGDKILLLENLLNEKDGKFNELLEEVNELRDSSSWLSQELESMISLNEKLTNNAQDNLTSTSDVLDSFNQRKRSQLIEQLKQLRLKNRSRVKASEFMLLNRRANGINAASSSLSATRRSPSKLVPNQKSISGRRRRANSNKLRQHRDASLFDELDESTNGTSSSSANRSPTSEGHEEEEEDDDEEDDEIDNNDAFHDGPFRRDLDPEREPLSEHIALELFTILRKFQAALQQRKDSFTSNTQHLYSPNSTDDSGISGDDSEYSKKVIKCAQLKPMLTFKLT